MFYNQILPNSRNLGISLVIAQKSAFSGVISSNGVKLGANTPYFS